jgi:arylsulfatase A-like enzyme
MPFLSRFIEHATVYHNHYAGGNFTTPGTASLLTGTLPWTHRAFRSLGTVAKPLATHNIFNAIGKKEYYRFAYSHNSFVERLLDQFENDLDYHIPRQELFLEKDWIVNLFSNDYDIAALSMLQILQTKKAVQKNSLFLPDLNNLIVGKHRERIQEQYAELFPRGLPKIGEDNYFLLEDGIDYLIDQLGEIPQPFLGYFHFLPPHRPYTPRREFIELFSFDGFQPPRKPDHILSRQANYRKSYLARTDYNQNIAYADAEFARLFKFMENTGLLENTWLVFTTDHGEMFERGIIGHRTEILHEPVIKVPLIIFEPGQTTQRDIFIPTSCIDVLPTLLHVTGQSIPAWVEGEILPPYRNSEPDTGRSIFAVQAKRNGVNNPLTEASVMMVKEQYKLHAYFGYDVLPPDETLYELYDLKNDPEELDNLYSPNKSLARELQNELTQKLDEVNEPYL